MSMDAQIGNLYEQPFEDIWNSQKAIQIRKQILKSRYPYCKLPFCISGSNYNFRLIPRKNVSYSPVQKSYPKMVSIGPDSECNLNCIMCRPSLSRLSDEELEIHNKRIDDLYLPILKDAEELTLSSTGDPFASRNTRMLMKKAAEIYPDLKFNLITNGLLCNRFNCDDVGITERLSRVMVSIHAATEETYNTVVKNGDFPKLIENLKWLSQMVGEGKIKELFFAFVVSAKNYKDIPAFIEFAKKNNAKALFWGCIDWGGNLDNYDEPLDIIMPEHPKYNEFVEFLALQNFADKNAYFSFPIKRLLKK